MWVNKTIVESQMALVNECDFIDLIRWEKEAPDVTILFPSGTFGYRSQHIAADMEANPALSVLIPPSPTSSITPTGRVIGYITGVELTNVIYSEEERYYKLYGYSQLIEANSAKKLLTAGAYKAFPLFPKILGNEKHVHGLEMVYYILSVNDNEDEIITYYNMLRMGGVNNHSLAYLEQYYPYPKVETDRYWRDGENPDEDLKELFISMLYYKADKTHQLVEEDMNGLYLRFLNDKTYRDSLKEYLPPIEYSAAVKLVLNYLKYGTFGVIGDQILFGSKLTWRLYGVKLDAEYNYPALFLIEKLASDVDLLNTYMVYAYDLDRPVDEILIGWYLTIRSLCDDIISVDHYEDITRVNFDDDLAVKVTNITKVSTLGWIKLYYNSSELRSHLNKMINIGHELATNFLDELYYYNYIGYGINIKDGRFLGLTNDGYIPLEIEYDWFQAVIDVV